MKAWMVFLLLGTPGAFATCPVPPSYDIKYLEYQLENIGSSLRVELEFPQLSTLTCDVRLLAFGTRWGFDLAHAQAIRVKVSDLNGVKVQEFSITGSVDLKVTSLAASLRFFSSRWSKAIGDHGIRIVELWSKSPLVPFPSIEILDRKEQQTLPATAVYWK